MSDKPIASVNVAAIELLEKWLSYPEQEETPAMKAFIERITGRADVEHERLQLAVVEAAVTFRAAETAHWVESEVGSDPARTQRERSQAYLRLTETVDALNRFEAEQKNGNTN
jgi:hypothetical protein